MMRIIELKSMEQFKELLDKEKRSEYTYIVIGHKLNKKQKTEKIYVVRFKFTSERIVKDYMTDLGNIYNQEIVMKRYKDEDS